MNRSDPDPLSRRDFVCQSAALAAAVVGSSTAPLVWSAAAAPAHPYLTPADEFYDVSRGNPKPHTLAGPALEHARLTPETWRLEITADPYVEAPIVRLPASIEKPRTLDTGSAFDLPALLTLGRKHEVSFLKAMQCLNIDTPLGQGLWTGVPLHIVLRECGKLANVRRIYYRGFHNDDPKQIFQSSVSYSQAMETPPGELPVFLAYRLNGQPIPLQRGGPVRMVVPWAHGFKSIKWLRWIFLTNDYRANDTYALQNNDPESTLKTAAYLDQGPPTSPAGQPLTFTGRVICGRSGLQRVEYWLRPVGPDPAKLSDDDPELLAAPWQPCALDPEPDWSAVLPPGVSSRQLLGFNPATGRPAAWPPLYSMASFSATLRDLQPGRYELRARAVDLNGYPQPEPRPIQKSGKNAIPLRRIQIV